MIFMTCSEQSLNQKAKKQKGDRAGLAMLLLKGHVTTGNDAATKFLDNKTGCSVEQLVREHVGRDATCGLFLSSKQIFFTRKLFIKYLDPVFLQS